MPKQPSPPQIPAPFPLCSAWDVQALGDVCKSGGGNIQTGPFGSQLHQSDYVQDGIPSIMPANIGDNRIIEAGIARITPEYARRLGKYRVRKGDIVYSRRGDVERRSLIREQEEGWLCGTGCLRVRLGDGVVDHKYASYYLAHPEVKSWVVRHAVGATMPNLNTSILSSLPFVTPPKKTQQAIAHILGTLDDKIDLNRRMNETLEAMVRALFKSWFVDFDPVKANMEGRQPAGMDAETAALFPDRLTESELGMIPEGWRIQKLSSLISIIGGGTPKKTDPRFWNGDIPWVSIKDLPETSDVFVTDTELQISELGLNKSSTKLLPIGATIISARGTIGRTGIVLKPMAMNQSCYGILGISGIGPYFTYYNLNHAVKTLAQNTHGAVFDTITMQTFDTHEGAFPGNELAQRFEEAVTPLMSMIAHNSVSISTLKNTRDTLLPNLISGKVSVGTVEKLIGEA